MFILHKGYLLLVTTFEGMHRATSYSLSSVRPFLESLDSIAFKLWLTLIGRILCKLLHNNLLCSHVQMYVNQPWCQTLVLVK